MSIFAAGILASASTTLLDPRYKRWPEAELISYINEAMKAIVARKPNAATQTVTINLESGTLQTLPAQYPILSRVTRNLTIAHGDPGGPVGGPVIRPIKSRDLLDAMIPGWQSNEVLFSATVKHVIYDLANPRVFYVAPGNNGTGMIEAVVGTIPASIALSSDAIPLPDIYRNLITDYVLFKAFSKDAGIPASEARAAAHFGMFESALVSLAEGEASLSMTSLVQPAG